MPINKRFGDIINKDSYQAKPLNFLPILNLQNDIDKMLKYESEKSFIGLDILHYLAELDIHLTSTCRQGCVLCDEYHKQSKSCFKTSKDIFLPVSTIQEVLEQAKFSSLSKINILGGNILLYPEWNILEILLSKYKFNYHYWINYLNFEEKILQSNVASRINITVSFPVQESILRKIISISQNIALINFVFFIENETQYKFVENLKPDHYNIVPVFNQKNFDFFKDYVFISENDLVDIRLSMREIFCNQKLNSNYFGILKIYSDGIVKTSSNFEALGNIHNDKLVDILYNEFIKNTAWRKIKSGNPCNNCSYRFLCPPPSNYEATLNRNNLCLKFID